MAQQRLVSLHRRPKASLLASEARAEKPRRPTPEQPLIISASELRDFLSCRVKHHWRYQCNLAPKAGAPALAVGSLSHQILEAWYSLPHGKRTVKAMERIAKARCAQHDWHELKVEDYELVRAMTIGYAAWAKADDAKIGLVDCDPESWFDYPLTPDGAIRVRGKIDNVFTPTTLKKTVACCEFKNKAKIDLNIVELNLQISVYLWALRQRFPKAKRYIAHYTVLRKQMPGPRVKADLFARESVERTDEQIDQWALDTQRAALDMLDGAVYANPSDQCQWMCDFKIPCLLRGSAGDLKHVLKTEYQQREYR
jgi:hypothetical protein